ncbi:hypothetical protein OSTOST_02345, partial [Ostertagia ostertagi]
MELPTVVQEKLIELHDENNQLKVIEQKNTSCHRLEEQIEVLATSLQSANRLNTPTKPERLQEERDDAVFELQRAAHRIAALEEERNDYAERAEAASSEARDMARHNKELREQLHDLEAELVASRTNTNVANRGNSMFAEFAEERVRLEGDLKLLYCKYSALRKENCQLANELDEARLLALRRGRRE